MEPTARQKMLLTPRRDVDVHDRERESVHPPSAIQPHGLLLAARCSDLRIAYASANTLEVLGVATESVLGLPLAHIVGDLSATLMASTNSPGSPVAPRRLTISLPKTPRRSLHANYYRHLDLLIVELEELREEGGWDRRAERMESVIEGLRIAETLTSLCDTAAASIRRLTGYDRVMVYRFHRDGHGEVIAEDRDPEVDALLNLHFPASDIPAQARELHLQQRTRLVADVDYTPVPVLGYVEFTGKRPLDMTYCELRTVSPVHIRYLKKMGVGASFVVSLIDDRKLWGLIVCHHRSPRLMPPELRVLCEVLGRIVSMLVGVTQRDEEFANHLTNRARLERLGEVMAPGGLVALVLADHPKELLEPMNATGALIQLQGYSRLIGETPSLEDARALMNAMQLRQAAGHLAYEAVGEALPEFAHLTSVASGAAMISLAESSDDGVLWFRPEVVQTINWGGNALEWNGLELILGRNCPPEPLAAWEQTRFGHSAPWTVAEIAMAQNIQGALTAALLHHAGLQAQLSYFDGLTGLPNRRVLLDRLARSAKSGPKPSACLIFIDIDRFRMVNDTLGHRAGDDLLIQVGQRLRECAGARHLVARLGGDEFVIFCENHTLEEGRVISHAIMRSFELPFLLSGKPFRCVTSIGLALAGSGQTSVADMLHAADSAMSAAKQRGGNQFVVFENQVHEKLLRQIQLEQDLFQAIERDEIHVHFQPQILVNGHRLIGFEALLRWKHPVYGDVSPAEFIPMAEYTGFIQTIGGWVLRAALRQIRIWRERFFPSLFVAVNVSVKQIAANDFTRTVQLALEETGTPSEALHLEVTESILMQPSAEPQLREIQALGVKIAIDDFGTGYSSLSYLPRLAVSEVKLDRSFLENVGTDERKTALFSAIVGMAHALDLAVVAEGIEEISQLDCIRECCCDGAQGYLLSRPISAQNAEQMFLGDWKDGLLLAS
jgi:diguanylate cyclase (GGDEF)-like protein